MPTLPRLSGRAVVKSFGRDGWTLARQKGSHISMGIARRAASGGPTPHESRLACLRFDFLLGRQRAAGLALRTWP